MNNTVSQVNNMDNFVKKDKMNDTARFVYPDKKIISVSKQSTNSYTHPLIGCVFWDRFKTAFKFLKQQQKRFNVIVELGCSYGFFLPSLCQLADKVIGTDKEGTFNSNWNKTLFSITQYHSNLEMKPADATRLSENIDQNSCDVIVAFSVFEHIQERERALKEVSKCLKDSGLFIIELPSENRLYKLGRKLIRYSDAHEEYNYNDTKKLINKYFIEKKMMNSPFGFPLFKIGVYTPK